MLERIEHANGVVIYGSPRLTSAGIAHAFTTRLGGISAPPFDTLNLDVRGKTRPAGHRDHNTSISANFRKLRQVLGVKRLMRAEARQVHGAAVWWPPAKPMKIDDAPEADALVTQEPTKLLCIRIADCVPILLASPDGRRVATVHAGWRGLCRGVIGAAVGQFDQPSQTLAAVGPSISVKHFEVDHEVAQRFSAPHVVRRDFGPKPHVDMATEASRQLYQAGVDQVDVADPDTCTYEREEEFFSHRRDVTHRGHLATGRMAAVICARGSGQGA